MLALLEENVPTPAELKRRAAFLKRLERLRSKRPPAAGPFPSAEQMQREDRGR